MAESGRRALELNEAKWWSRWARLNWLDRTAYTLTSGRFREPFFNKACFIGCAGVDRFLSSIEVRFRGSGLEPTILIGAKCTRSLGVLRRAGYRVVDSMSVLELGRPSFNTNDSIAVRAVKSSSQQDWSRAYLQSFYGDTKLLPHVKRIVKRLSGLRDVVLLEAILRGRTAGVLAVQRSKGLAGAYCVGTLPRFRRMGVAGTLITAAGRIAEEEGRRLILQTLESDRAETFYLRGGFRKLYAKKVLSRGLKT